MKQRCSAWPCQVDQASGSAKSNPHDWRQVHVPRAANQRALNPGRWTARLCDRKRRVNESKLAGGEDWLAQASALEWRIPLQSQTIGVAKRLTYEASFGVVPVLGRLFVRIP